MLKEERKKSGSRRSMLSKLQEFCINLGIDTTRAPAPREPTCFTLNGTGFKIRISDMGVGYRPVPVSDRKFLVILP